MENNLVKFKLKFYCFESFDAQMDEFVISVVDLRLVNPVLMLLIDSIKSLISIKALSQVRLKVQFTAA